MIGTCMRCMDQMYARRDRDTFLDLDKEHENPLAPHTFDVSISVGFKMSYMESFDETFDLVGYQFRYIAHVNIS